MAQCTPKSFDLTGKVALITGASYGIGMAIAKAMAANGATIVFNDIKQELVDKGIAAYEEAGIKAHGYVCDVTDEDAVNAMVAKITEEVGHINILVNNAGFGISGAAELTDTKDSHAQLELNVFGTDNVTRAVLPHMRAQGGGRIVCMSSIAGIVPIPFQLWYSVSKAAIIAYVLALQNEVKPFNISVCAIMPGDIASGFTDARKKSGAGDDVYAGRIERSVAVMEHDERTGMSPEFAGKFVAKYALKKSSRPLVAMGAAYKGAAALVKLLPRQTSNWLVGKIYAK